MAFLTGHRTTFRGAWLFFFCFAFFRPVDVNSVFVEVALAGKRFATRLAGKHFAGMKNIGIGSSDLLNCNAHIQSFEKYNLKKLSTQINN